MTWALIAMAASLTSALPTGWQPGMNGLRSAWNLTPADASRRHLWEARTLSKGSSKVLVTADSSRDGSVRALEWSAENGVLPMDLADEVFWAILDGTSQDAEWAEADPDALPKSFLKAMGAPPAQGFLCHSCKPRLAAATFVRHGVTLLRIAPIPDPASPLAAGLAPGISETGLRSLAAQRQLVVAVVNPCSDKGGACSLELTGSDGQHWIFSRRDGASAWNHLNASYQAGAWWTPEWNWDSLRIQSPREFKTLVRDWIGSQADMLAEKLLAPIEPVLAFPVSSWKNRLLPGLTIQSAADSIAALKVPPSTLILSHSTTFSAQIDAFGRRSFKLGENLR